MTIISNLLINTFMFLTFLSSFSSKQRIEKTLYFNTQNNTDEILNNQEAELLNTLLKNTRDTFDFRGKKIAFITGSLGKRFLSKKSFFDSCITPWLAEGDMPQISIIILTKNEKYNSRGYDVFVLTWVKVFTNRQKKRMINKLAKNEE